jgi:hypothetical protein
MNIVAPADRRRSPQSTVFYNRPLSSIPTVFTSLQARAIAMLFLRSAAIRGENENPAYDS